MAAASAAGAAVRVLLPPDGATLTSPTVLLVFVAEPREIVRISLGGRIVDAPVVRAGGPAEAVRHVRLPLEIGTTELQVSGARGSADVKVRVTRTSPRDPAGTALIYAFHTGENEGVCSSCHGFEVSPDASVSAAESPCRGCHQEVFSFARLHGPVAVGACLACHDRESRPSRFSVRGAGQTLCDPCHPEVKARILSGKSFAHGPVGAGQCKPCHGPHGGATAMLLSEKEPQLCLGCHEGTMPRPVSRSLHAKVPCTRCHDPHGGATPELTSIGGNAFCQGCHAGVGDRDHPFPGHPVSSVAGQGIRPARPLGCVSCHAPHGVEDVSKQRIFENDVAQRKFCRRCHE